MKNWNLGFAEGRTPIRSYKILIADNEYLIRWSLCQALSQQGYEVVSVEDGKKAIEAATAQHFDFIITDIYMPELDGWEVLEMLRQTQPPPRMIIITAHGNEETCRMAKEKGAWAYVEKPYIIDKIKEMLEEAFKNETSLNSN
jgi:DNA-binding NtrC family response regulator